MSLSYFNRDFKLFSIFNSTPLQFRWAAGSGQIIQQSLVQHTEMERENIRRKYCLQKKENRVKKKMEMIGKLFSS